MDSVKTEDSDHDAAQKPQAVHEDVSAVAKTIDDLDRLVGALLAGLPAMRPWQRQARAQWAEADRSMQVLRLAISLDRDQEELLDAAKQVQLSVRAAQVFIAPARADLAIKAAAKLTVGLADRLYAALVGAASTK